MGVLVGVMGLSRATRCYYCRVARLLGGDTNMFSYRVQRLQVEREREREREREISSCKNKEYKKAKSFIWMFLKNNPDKR